MIYFSDLKMTERSIVITYSPSSSPFGGTGGFGGIGGVFGGTVKIALSIFITVEFKG
jgi:hypothetical protein